jgi:hypothetical protein
MDRGDKLFSAKGRNLFPGFLPETDDEYIEDTQFLSPCDSRRLVVLVRFERTAKQDMWNYCYRELEFSTIVCLYQNITNAFDHIFLTKVF